MSDSTPVAVEIAERKTLTMSQMTWSGSAVPVGARPRLDPGAARALTAQAQKQYCIPRN